MKQILGKQIVSWGGGWNWLRIVSIGRLFGISSGGMWDITLCTGRFNIQQFHVLPTHCIYVFCVDLRTNSYYFPIQHQLTGFYNQHDKSSYSYQKAK